MFIKLTRLDGTPIWINASFVVTVEPRKGGGSVVVPIGDGLDYDVKEKTDDVLALLGAAPAPQVVPVPAPKLLAPTHDDIELAPDVPEKGPVAADDAAASGEPEDFPLAHEMEAGKTRKTSARAGAKKTTRAKSRAKTPAPASPSPSPSPAPSPVPSQAPSPSPALDAEQVARLRKMAPRTQRRLLNTLVTQFKVADAEATVAALVGEGVLSLDREHVVWSQPEA